ncbi:MAG: hypothetical protein M3O36_01945 [Myxococcota bacterium]|nr:hypothetical protein [Myxococcota bacterium]
MVAGECALPPAAAAQLVDYVAAQRAALGVVPTMDDVVFERFFDEAGGMQLVVHAPFGGRINRAFGLALRKRFCVSFDFELQAAATDDAIVLSMGSTQSFPLSDAFHFVRADQLRPTLEQAILAAPMFGTRWRWNASRALAVARRQGGKKVPPFLQRMRADDLLASVFPAQVACQENAPGPVAIPDHPLVRQTVHDCLFEAMDTHRLRGLLERMERGELRVHARDTTEPSPFSHEVLNAKPYAYLDDAPLEERRARALSLRRTLPDHQRDLGELDAAAIASVVAEAMPAPRDADELHDALLGLVVARVEDAWSEWFDMLRRSGRASVLASPAGPLAVATENVRLVEVVYPGSDITPRVSAPPKREGPAPPRDDALVALVRGQAEVRGPFAVSNLAADLGLDAWEVASAAARLESEGCSCAASSPAALRTGSSATGVCSRAFTAARSTGCAARSSPSACRISCDFSSFATTARRVRALAAGRRSATPSACCKAWRSRRPRGRRRCSRLGSPVTGRSGSMSSVWEAKRRGGASPSDDPARPPPHSLRPRGQRR